VSPAWPPLLDATRRDRALDAVDAIAHDLASIPEENLTAPQLASVALFESYRAVTAGGDGTSVRRCDRLVDSVCVRLADEPGTTSLHGGLAGSAWMIEHVQRILHPGDAHDLNASVDEAMTTILDAWSGDFDVIDGLAGIGVYALERGAAGRPCVQRIVSLLRASAVRDRDCLAWCSPLDSAASASRGRFNLGVAHGTPGVLSLVARVCAESDVDAGDLMEGAARWTIAGADRGGDHPLPTWLGGDQVTAPGWCYGRPGIAAALVVAASAAPGHDAWRAAGLTVARAQMGRPENARIDDAGLCHGAAGLAHIYQRLHGMTGDDACAEESIRWFDKALAMRRRNGIGGYEFLVPMGPHTPERHWSSDPSFLTGAVGVGLSLLAGLSPTEPLWDRLLLLAPPGRVSG
jgi:hypothetical protein